MNRIALLMVIFPALLIAYSYVAYPAILWLLAPRRRPNAPRTSDVGAGELPLVTVVIPAYNEERQIAGAIEAVLAQDYPAERRQILVLSDASSDRTDEIVQQFRTKGVELLRMPRRAGKTAAENAACQYIRGEIVVNSDASVRLDSSAVSLLAAALRDPSVGVVSARDVSVAPGERTANAAEAGYVGYEMWIRDLETRFGGIVGASGSGYAIRAHLHRIPIRDDLSRDFSAALTARVKGYRAVSIQDALCFVPRTSSLRAEYRRKVRTISRGIETLMYRWRLMDPIAYGSFAWKLLSHKVCRWAAPASCLIGLVGLVLLSRTETIARWLLAFVVAAAGVAAIGWMWPRDRRLPRMISVVAFGVSANVAVIHAIWRVLIGHQDHVWEPTRRPTQGEESIPAQPLNP